jgi:hypothetical protein
LTWGLPRCSLGVVAVTGELVGVEDPKVLVPGEPSLVWEMASSFGGIGVALEQIGLGFRGVDDGGWQGAAAEAFRACFEGQPRRFLQAADAFGDAAVALDSYASALSWAQRQAGEAVALARESREVGEAVSPPSLSVGQQVELGGVVVSSGDLPFSGSSRESRGAAADVLSRARGQLHRIGCDVAGKVRVAGELAPLRARLLEVVAASPAPTARPKGRPVVMSTFGGALSEVVGRQPGLFVPQRLELDVLRDRPGVWEAGVAELRKVLRLGLDQLSPRLRQHVFEGHVKKRRQGNGYRELGYHHREGGVDRGTVRVLRVVARPDLNGVYRARVAGPRTVGGSEFRTSTFFPDSWTRADVLRAIRTAFLGRTFFDMDDPKLRRRWRGRAGTVVIEGYVESQFIEPTVNAASARLYHVVTAYPLYQGGDGRGRDD